MKKAKYKFSVIIPVYNVENYLEETVDSVINQTIGFKDNIQIILVNDGSPDDSEKICLKYKELYPNNIVYVKQENSGVSAARNKGIEYIEGKYVNFLDSDDKWQSDVFEKAYKMFESNDDIDVIGVRQKFFEALDTYPSLDYKFNEDKVVDIFNYYNHIQLSVTSGFFRASAIGNVRYDTRVKFSEDAKFIFDIILNKGKLGIISSSVHYYRKRFSENSAIQTKNSKDDWYLITPELCYKYVIDLSIKKYGYVIPFVQYYIMYDYQFRAKEGIPSSISTKTKEQYMKITKELIKYIDDNIIMEQRSLVSEYKYMFLCMKYDRDIKEEFRYVRHNLRFQGYNIVNFENEYLLNLTIMNFKKNTIELKGLINCLVNPSDYEVYVVKNNKEKIKLDLIPTKLYERKFFNEPFISNMGFKVEIDKKDITSLHFELVYKKNYMTQLRFITGIDAKIDMKKKIFYIDEDKLYYCKERKIVTAQNSIGNIMRLGAKNVYFDLKNNKWKVVVYRMIYHILKMFNHKKIWIISDRPFVANDNGYAFFKYVNSIKTTDIKTYFTISKKSPDFEKVKKTGNVLPFNSLKYKIYFLMADKIISSQADPWVTNAFGKKHKYYHDLYNADFVFLQHGIIKDDLSTWLNEFEKNMSIFVTSAKDEWDSIVNGKYGFDESVVKLTGMPRYDLLGDDSKNEIIIMPTWRANLAGAIDPVNGKRIRNSGFNKSEYFKFYNDLINDQKLLETLKKRGYTGKFVVHPSHLTNASDFKGNDIIKVENNAADYSKLFRESKLLISDFSSVPFDFAYMHKPVLYAQFDKDTFFKSHIYTSGYFDYEKDGFGPVTYDYKTTIDEIIKFIENDCKIDKKYDQRINKFYRYHDKENSKRVYEEIIKL